MKKNAPRCDEILIFIIFVGRQRFRRVVFAGYHLEQLFLGILFEKTGSLGSSQVF